MEKYRDTIIWVLTTLVTLFGRVPRIGPALQLLLLLVTQYWPEIAPLIKQLPPKMVERVTAGEGRRIRLRGLLLSRCRTVGAEE